MLSALFVVVVTIWAEKSPPLKNWLAEWSGHHWVSKSIFSLLIYFSGLFLFYYVPKQVDGNVVRKYLNALLATTFLSALAIFAFYTGHHLGVF